MSIELIREFFLWCMVINFGIYALTAIAIVALRGFICRLQGKLFGLDEKTVSVAMFAYLAGYKLLITCFAFAPWLALTIMA